MTRSTFVVALLACAALAGCATAPVSSDTASAADEIFDVSVTTPHAGTARIVVVRDSGFTGSACDDLVYLDGMRLAKLDTGQKVTAYVEPGHHVLGTTASGICAGGSAGIDFDVRAGDVRLYRVGSTQGGTLFVQPSPF